VPSACTSLLRVSVCLTLWNVYYDMSICLSVCVICLLFMYVLFSYGIVLLLFSDLYSSLLGGCYALIPDLGLGVESVFGYCFFCNF